MSVLYVPIRQWAYSVEHHQPRGIKSSSSSFDKAYFTALSQPFAPGWAVHFLWWNTCYRNAVSCLRRREGCNYLGSGSSSGGLKGSKCVGKGASSGTLLQSHHCGMSCTGLSDSLLILHLPEHCSYIQFSWKYSSVAWASKDCRTSLLPARGVEKRA